MFHVALFSSMASADAGACRADEQSRLADLRVVGDRADAHGAITYEVVAGIFSHDKFNDWFAGYIGLGATRAEYNAYW